MTSRASAESQQSVPTASRLVWRPAGGRLVREPDELAVEEPLELRVRAGTPTGRRDADSGKVLAVTMRTPGRDFELAAGFALAERVIDAPSDLAAVRYCTDPRLDGEQRYNVVTIELSASGVDRLARRGGLHSRVATTSSSCGVCGAASIEVLAASVSGEVCSDAVFPVDSVVAWPELLRASGQAGFAATGGLHAAGLVSRSGELLVAREDIGRHNAVDKVAGWALAEAAAGRLELPLVATGLVVSGRISFEIVQKALRLGTPLVAGVSAASSLAVRLGEELGITVAGFVRDGSCTVYCHPERLAG